MPKHSKSERLRWFFFYSLRADWSVSLFQYHESNSGLQVIPLLNMRARPTEVGDSLPSVPFLYAFYLGFG